MFRTIGAGKILEVLIICKNLKCFVCQCSNISYQARPCRILVDVYLRWRRNRKYPRRWSYQVGQRMCELLERSVRVYDLLCRLAPCLGTLAWQGPGLKFQRNTSFINFPSLRQTVPINRWQDVSIIFRRTKESSLY